MKGTFAALSAGKVPFTAVCSERGNGPPCDALKVPFAALSALKGPFTALAAPHALMGTFRTLSVPKGTFRAWNAAKVPFTALAGARRGAR